MTLSQLHQRTLSLAVLLLGSLILRPATTHAEAPRFAHGFVIYKKALSDQPAYYHGTLYLSADTTGPIWLQYDVGQAKPFFVAREMFVQDIKFGTLFEADFTSQKHVDYCRGIQAQLAAAAKASPLIATAATAASRAIQAEIDQFGKGLVRYQGRWIPQARYTDITTTAEKARMAAAAARKAEDETIRANMEQTRAADLAREVNLSHAYPSLSAKYGIRDFSNIVDRASATAKHRLTLPITLPSAGADLIELPQYRDVTPMLRILGDPASDTASAAILTFNQERTQLREADITLCFARDPGSAVLSPRTLEEQAPPRRLLEQFDPNIYPSIPDVLAATQIKNSLAGGPPKENYTEFIRIDIPGYDLTYRVWEPQADQGRTLQVLHIILRPLLPASTQ